MNAPAYAPMAVRCFRAALAQPVEHRIRNAGVRCSSHLSGTITLFARVRKRLKSPAKSVSLNLNWPRLSASVRPYSDDLGATVGAT